MKNKLLLMSAGLLSTSLSRAQMTQDTIQSTAIDQVIITGTRTARDIATLPLPTQIITGESIRNSGMSRLNEIIQEQTGLFTVPDFGGGEGIQMQGLDAAYVMILIDGQPLFGRSAGTLDLGRISINNIDRIEVVKGASSSLYGSEALAGVINIITKDPKKTNGVEGNFAYKIASFNTHDASAGLRYGRDRLKADLFINLFKTGGYNLSGSTFSQTVEPYFNTTIQPKIKYQFSDQLQLTISNRIFHQDQDYKSEVQQDLYQGKSKITEWNQSLILEHKWNKNLKLQYDFYFTNYKANEYLDDHIGQRYEQSDFNQWYIRPEIRLNYKYKKHNLTTGIGLNHETLERTDFKDRAKLSSEYIFGQMEWFIGEKWNLLTGFRLDQHHQYKSQFSPKVGVNYKLTDDLSIKSSIGYGYKAPDLRQLYFNFNNSAIGYTVLGYNVAEDILKELDAQGQIAVVYPMNFAEPLKPESSINFNLGSYYKKNRWTIDANIFYNRIKNLIDSNIVAQKTNGQNVFSYFNLNKIFTYGVEFNSSYKVDDKLTISAGYQYLIAKDQTIVDRLKNGEIFARNPETLDSFKLQSKDYFGLYNRSRHSVTAKLNYEIPQLHSKINLRLVYRSKYGIADSNSNEILDKYDQFVKGYLIANLALTTELKYEFSLQAGALNLFDYTDKNNISNLPGRQFFGKIMYHF